MKYNMYKNKNDTKVVTYNKIFRYINKMFNENMIYTTMSTHL